MNQTISNGLGELLTALLLIGYALWGSLQVVKSYESAPEEERRFSKADKFFLAFCACIAHVGFTLCELSGNSLHHTRSMSILALIFMNIGIAMLYASIIRATWLIVMDTATWRSLTRCGLTWAGSIALLWACMS